jgi:beta-lactamase superfamily II metal-dependent hydrolase
LARYAALGVRMRRTDLDGAVTVTVDAQGRLSVTCVRGCP